MNSLRLAGVTLAALMITACTKPLPADTGAEPAPAPTSEGAAATSPATTSDMPAAAPVSLYNAYTASTLTQDGTAGEPSKAFKTSDKIYVGAVVHGQAAASSIKVEWSVDGATSPNSGETSIPVTGASVATVELTKAGPLAAGSYKVLVYLDGAPGWELAFDVTQ